MICPNCKKEGSQGASFCTSCGTSLEVQQNGAPDTASQEKKHQFEKNKLFGFRSGILYKKIIAVIVLSIMVVFTVMVLMRGIDNPPYVYDAVIFKMQVVLGCASFWIPYLILSNIAGVREYIPLYKNHNVALNMIGVIITALLLIMTARGLVIFYSEEYLSRGEITNQTGVDNILVGAETADETIGSDIEIVEETEILNTEVASEEWLDADVEEITDVFSEKIESPDSIVEWDENQESPSVLLETDIETYDDTQLDTLLNAWDTLLSQYNLEYEGQLQYTYDGTTWTAQYFFDIDSSQITVSDVGTMVGTFAAIEPGFEVFAENDVEVILQAHGSDGVILYEVILFPGGETIVSKNLASLATVLTSAAAEEFSVFFAVQGMTVIVEHYLDFSSTDIEKIEALEDEMASVEEGLVTTIICFSTAYNGASEVWRFYSSEGILILELPMA